MSHPNPSHERSNEYPEDKVTSYPQRKKKARRAKSGGPLHNVADRLSAHARALQKRMNEVGGRFTKK